MAHWTISAPPTDRGKVKILKLQHKVGKADVIASTNDKKSTALAKCFFPTKPQEEEQQVKEKYLKACKGVGRITREQIWDQLRKTKPYKALGPDGIPNIVLSNCTDLIVDRLYFIYKAMLKRGLFYRLWKISTMVVLQNPGKPRYDIPKAYRPIALLNMMWKILSTIVASHITHLAKKH